MEFKNIKSDKVVTARLKHADITAEIIGMQENSRTLVLVKDIEKGKGWSDGELKFTGVRHGSGWFRGENYGFGDVHIVHRDNLFEEGAVPVRGSERHDIEVDSNVAEPVTA